MIYLDYNSTSPGHPEVSAAVSSCLKEFFGNASSLHAAGRQARTMIEKVRVRCLQALGDPSGQLVFTSGGTEADNLAVRSVLQISRNKGNHLIVSSVEHSAVLQTAKACAREGAEVSFVPVDAEGVIDLEALRRAITPRTILISVMHANNEVGTIEPIQEIAALARQRGIIFHSDAVQSFGKITLNVKGIGVDLVSFSGHKLGAPKGVGALYIRQGLTMSPLLYGGPHERNLRAGTENVPGIVGMGIAVEIAVRQLREGVINTIQRLRDRLETGLKEKIPQLTIQGSLANRLPNTLNVSFCGCDGETLLMALDLAGICVSTGSACSSGSIEPSHVLVAMGLSPEQIGGSIRFSLGWGTTEAEIDECLQKIPFIIERVRKASKEQFTLSKPANELWRTH